MPKLVKITNLLIKLCVQIDVQNIGSLEGEAEVTIEIMRLDGSTELLRRTNDRLMLI